MLYTILLYILLMHICMKVANIKRKEKNISLVDHFCESKHAKDKREKKKRNKSKLLVISFARKQINYQSKSIQRSVLKCC